LNSLIACGVLQQRRLYGGRPALPPDIIVLDIVMPKMDGFELVQWSAAQQSVARIIIVTGCNPHYAKMIQNIGTAHGILSITSLVKPIAITDLKAALAGDKK
jgi:YesN/AraC family two-component response regulator